MTMLNELSRLEAAASPRNWAVKFHNFHEDSLDFREREIVGATIGSNFPLSTPEGLTADADVELIVALRNNARALIECAEILGEYSSYLNRLDIGDCGEAGREALAKLGV